MESKEKNNDTWIRMASKSHPGRFYMFNKATGETQWLSSKDSSEGDNKIESPPKLNLSKAAKTPAQDRLKRLQHNLKTIQKRSQISNASGKATNLEAGSKKEPENHLKEEPSTSSSHKSPKRATKRSAVDDKNSANIKKMSSKDEIKRAKLSTVLNNTIEETETESSRANTRISEKPETSGCDNSSALNNLRRGIVKKIKEFCKIPFNLSQKSAKLKSSAKDDKSSSNSLVNSPAFKAKKRLSLNKERHSTSLQDSLIDELRSDNDKLFNLNLMSPLPSQSTSKNIINSSHIKGSANSRLERLKQSLLLQQQQQQQQQQQPLKQQQPKHPIQTLITNDITKNITETSEAIVSSVSESTENSTDNVGITIHTNNISTAKSTNNDELEAMDWQPIVKDEESNESTKPIDSGLIIEKSKKCPFSIKDANDNQTMGDIYDTVNENLLRYCAENQKDITDMCNDKWQDDCFYFVIDTNVLLKDLTFVEDLSKMKLCGTKASILYLPYTVLQELDKLKMRSGMQEGVKTLAIRAIKYLNEKFEQNSFHIKAQSALDEKEHLITISSPDDSILNCCLQAKRHVSKLLLLSEDVNLRNKAICNNISVSTKSDLISKRYDFDDTYMKS